MSNLNTFVLERKIMAHRFEIDDMIRRQYRWYNVVGTQLTLRLLHPLDNSDPVGYFLASVNDVFEYSLQDVSDMVGITIQNQVNQNDRPSASVLGGKISCPEKWYGVSSRESRNLILDLTPWTPLL